MKLQTIIILLVAKLALCQSGLDLLTALESDPNTKAFGELLKDFPDLVTHLDPTKQYTVFAPSNEAVAAFRASLNSSGAIIGRSNRLNRRSIPPYAATIALHFTDHSNQANLNTQPTDLISNLTDPAYINVVPASNSAILTESSSVTPSSAPSTSIQSTSTSLLPISSSVPPTTSSAQPTASSTPSTLTTASISQSPTSAPSSSPPPPPPPPNAGCPTIPPRKNINSNRRRTSSNSTISVYSGFGDSVSASLNERPYCNGTIRTVDKYAASLSFIPAVTDEPNSFFTLFGDLPTTLAKTNGSAFSAALSQANTLEFLSNTPRITVFVPTDAALQGRTLDSNALKRYILFDTLATTTTLTDGSLKSSSGENVKVTILADGTYTVNNVKISGENVMIKNGVAHYIDGVSF